MNGNSFNEVSELLEFSAFSNPLSQFLHDWFSKDNDVVVHTSGSTGAPKAIRLRKDFMENSAIATGHFFELESKTKALCCLPIDFIAGKMMVVRALVLGWHLDVVEPGSNPLENLSKTYDFSAMVPLQAMNSISKLNQIDKLIVGGGEVSQLLEEKLQTVVTKAFATYGMTETITHVAVKPLNQQSTVKSGFKAISNVSFSIDERNCLLIKAPKVSSELIRTNDVVEWISDTEFQWLGRFDNVINSGGIKLQPELIEKKLAKVISQRFFVAGIPDETLGEKLILIVEENRNAILSTVKKSLKNQTVLSKYEIPKQIFFVEEFIETKTGKIHRTETLNLLAY